MRRNLFILLGLFTGLAVLQGQSYYGNLETYLNSLVEIIPGKNGNQFVPPGSGELETWREMIADVLSGDLAGAREKAELLNYKVTDFEDPGDYPPSLYFVVEEKSPRDRYWGTYVFNRDPLRPGLVLQAPHTLYDLNTGCQAIFCFKRLDALALFFSGAHRCNHDSHTECSGSTTVCSGSSEPYRISDNAHNTNSAFQASTEVVFAKGPDTTVFVQLHGFTKQESDPYLIMSNGTRITPETDPIGTLKNELLLEDNELTSKVAHLDLDWTRLIALTNTQGRFINGSSDPCTEDATECGGRFIHIEQERTRLRADSAGWYKMYMALARTFPAKTSGTGFTGSDNFTSVRVFPNPARGSMHVEATAPYTYSLHALSGQCLLESFSMDNCTDIALENFAPGIYLIRVRDRMGTSWGKVVVQK
jgi:hypothetical protein